MSGLGLVIDWVNFGVSTGCLYQAIKIINDIEDTIKAKQQEINEETKSCYKVDWSLYFEVNPSTGCIDFYNLEFGKTSDNVFSSKGYFINGSY